MKRRILVLSILFLLGYLPLGAGEKGVTEPLQTFRSSIREEFEKHNYKKVIHLYRDFLEDYPQQFVPLTARVYYSQSLANSGDLETAIEVLQGTLQDMPPQMDTLRLLYDLANLFFMEKRYPEARKVYQKILVQYSQYSEVLNKTRERLALMQSHDSKKKDVTTLQLIEIETSLEAGEVPEGAESFLKTLQAQQKQDQFLVTQATRLLDRIQSVRTEKAKHLLDEARRLFDEERKYAEVKGMIDEIKGNYWDVSEKQSVNALLEEVNRREGKVRSPHPTN